AGAFAVRRTGDVMSRGCGLKFGYGFHGDGRLRQESEELRKLRLHLGNVAAENAGGLFRGSGNVFCVGLEGLPEGIQVSEARLSRDHGHFGLDAIDLATSELVYRICCHASSGPSVNVISIALLTVW